MYEEEETLFFKDRSAEVIRDDVFMRLLTFPNVLVTAHPGFFTRGALAAIAETTRGNVTAFATGEGSSTGSAPDVCDGRASALLRRPHGAPLTQPPPPRPLDGEAALTRCPSRRASGVGEAVIDAAG